MRYFALLVLLVLPAAADAQQREREPRPPSRPTPSRAAEPRIGQPLLPAGWEWFGTRGDDRRSWKRGPHGRWGWYGRPGVGYGYGGSYLAEEYDPRPYEQVAQPPVPITGLLRLEITPAVRLYYYVDGVAIGSSNELGLEFELNAGPRRIEIRSAGYRSIVFDTRIDEGRTTTYRGALEPLVDAAATDVRPTGNRTMYVIPGCFMGNAPPRQENLPKGCDIGKVRTR